MSTRKYTKTVEKELVNLAQIAEERELEGRLKEIASVTSRWKKKQLNVTSAMESIKNLANTPPMAWLSESDPGMPVAHSVSTGLLSKKDMSAEAWKAIEVLITVVEL